MAMRKLFFIRQDKEFLIILICFDINKEGKVEEERWSWGSEQWDCGLLKSYNVNATSGSLQKVLQNSPIKLISSRNW